MTIFDTGYSAFRYKSVGPFGRIWPLTRTEFQKLFKTKKGLMLFVACVIYVAVLLIAVYFNLGSTDSEGLQQGLAQLTPRLSPFEREFYLGYSITEGFLAFILLTSVIGVRSIAGDKSVNALEIYWTRGISPWGYFVGKWMGSFLLLAAVFVAGPLVAWLYALISAPDATFFNATIGFIPWVILALLLKSLILSFLAVAFSGLGSSPNTVTFLWLLLILGSAGIVQVLKLFTRIARQRDSATVSAMPDWYDAICPWNAMARIEKGLSGIASSTDYPIWIAWFAIGVLVAVLLFLLRKHLRTTEAMS